MPRFDCVNKGCDGIGFIEISDKTYEKMQEHGQNDPAHCITCKQWRNALEDYMGECQACGITWLITIGKQRMYHKYNGKWENPQYCGRCTKNPDMVARYLNQKKGDEAFEEFIKNSNAMPFDEEIMQREENRLRDELEYIKTNLLINSGVVSDLSDAETIASLQQISSQIHPKSVTIVTDPDFYKHFPDYSRRGIPGVSTSYGHIASHFNDLRERLNATDVDDGLQKLQELAQCTDPTRVVDFKIDGGIVKYDIQTQIQTVLRPYDSPPPEYRIATAYCPKKFMDPLEWVVTKISSCDWELPDPPKP